ncbi:Hpt domain protein [Tribonema minus]|uniref:Hpt domain protein n=1 Tax=Tribonema minus TaxID=303371 RepID=A0A835Z3I2_9STRA|nr:Hpt domain protein [Tribonema minus]
MKRGSAAKRNSGGASPQPLVVVDWTMALEQCGGDEEFLKELLVDLWTESSSHLEELQSTVPARNITETRNIAHTMKGAAGNLMCFALHHACLTLEKTAHEGTSTIPTEQLFEAMKDALVVIQGEMARFEEYLHKRALI